jgi:hypothetical protein
LTGQRNDDEEMNMTRTKWRAVTIPIDSQRWRGLEFQAGLMSQVFGQRITPQDVLQATVEKALKNRAPRRRQ